MLLLRPQFALAVQRFQRPRQYRRVSAGSIMSSTSLRPAATYGFENVSRYSSTSSLRRAAWSSAASISLRNTISAAPSAPITAISAVGHASTRSAPSPREHMAMYAPP